MKSLAMVYVMGVIRLSAQQMNPTQLHMGATLRALAVIYLKEKFIHGMDFVPIKQSIRLKHVHVTIIIMIVNRFHVIQMELVVHQFFLMTTPHAIQSHLVFAWMVCVDQIQTLNLPYHHHHHQF